jgi:hypothetical protein
MDDWLSQVVGLDCELSSTELESRWVQNYAQCGFSGNPASWAL